MHRGTGGTLVALISRPPLQKSATALISHHMAVPCLLSCSQLERNGPGFDCDWTCRHAVLIAATSVPLAWIRVYQGPLREGGYCRGGVRELLLLLAVLP